jgi:RNA recognition motif-containing protein
VRWEKHENNCTGIAGKAGKETHAPRTRTHSQTDAYVKSPPPKRQKTLAPPPPAFVPTVMDATSCKLFIGNLSWEASKKDVTELCSAYGNVWDVRIATNPATGQGRGFCHVEFQSADQAAAAAKGLMGKTFFDREITTKSAVAKPTNPKKPE